MRVGAVKDAIGELIAAIVLVALLLFSALGTSGCRSPAIAAPRLETGAGLTVAEQHAAAVRIDACGYYGSGVVIGPGRVLTAAHVVMKACPFLVVTAADGKRYRARRQVAWADDIALVYVSGLATQTVPPIDGIGSGDRVCFAPGAPRRARSCGAVYSVTSRIGGIYHSAITVPGNSGAGVYDLRGRLVGIVVWYVKGAGGMATPIGDRLEVAP